MTESQSLTNVLFELTHFVDRVFADGCREYALTTQQAKLLYLLDDGPITMGPLSERLMLERSSLTGLVDRGVKRGLVRRFDSPQDRRVRQVALTGEGERVVRQVRQTVLVRVEALVAPLSAGERDRLSELITHIVTASQKSTVAA